LTESGIIEVKSHFFMTKIKTHLITKKQFVAIFALLALVFVSQTHPLIAQSVTQGYSTDENIQRGMMVRLSKTDTGKVTFLTNDSVDDMFGVVVSRGDSPLTVTTEGQQVYVANSGQHEVLVSDQNGNVGVGDLVTISAIAGVGMKAGNSQSLVLGKSLNGFDPNKGSLSSSKVKNASGQEQTVKLGLTTVDIDVTRNPLLKGEAQVPAALKKAAQDIAGKDKEVGANRIYIGVVVLILASVVSAIVLYAGIHSAMIALGRNPLSRKTIIRSMIQVVIISLIIFLSGLFGVYLLLKL
jgi:hypothetical protein